jgi:malate synthase
MTYGYMRTLRGPRAPGDEHAGSNGRFALWQGGMEPNIPVGSERRRAGDGARGGRRRARAARGCQAASGSPTGRWSTSSGRCGRRSGRRISWAAHFRRSTYTAEDAAG